MVRTAPDASMEAAPVPSIDCIAAGGGQRRDSGFLSGIFTAHIDLASFCATFECPYRSIQDFLKMYSCSPIDPGGSASDTPRLIGCGLETVGGIGIFGGTQYAFDATTGALVGAKTASDTPFGPCNSALYLAGRLRSECASETLYDCRAIP